MQPLRRRIPRLNGRVLLATAAVSMVIGAAAMLRADAQPAPIPPTEELVFVSVAPERILDTRNGNGDPRTPPGQKIGAGQSLQLDVAGRTLASGLTIPEEAVAVMVNATITEASDRTFVTFHPSGTTRPEASSLNAVFGQNLAGLGSEDVPNMITVQIGDNGNVAVFNFAGATHVLADIAGYFIPADLGAAESVAVEATTTVIDAPTTVFTVGTFTAPAAGDWALNGAVNALLETTDPPASGIVECRWNTGDTAIPFGESLAIAGDGTGIARAGFAVDGHALDLAAGDTVAFECRATELASGGVETVTIDAVLTAEALTETEAPPPTTTTTTTAP